MLSLKVLMKIKFSNKKKKISVKLWC